MTSHTSASVGPSPPGAGRVGAAQLGCARHPPQSSATNNDADATRRTRRVLQAECRGSATSCSLFLTYDSRVPDAVLHPTLAARTLAIGDRIADRYELRARLGAGGMGAVWRVLDHELDEEVALKVLHGDGALSADAAMRFRREVKLARRVTHANVARTYDLGRHEGLAFLTMELIEGESLGARMRSRVPLVEALRIVTEVAHGLAAAHAQGVVHRDLKPDNVMLSRERVAITDFGVARSDTDGNMATSGSIVGTPAYMAPEQLGGRDLDGRADVYALGVVLFELVTGQLPFHGDTPFAMAAARLGTVPADPRTLDASVPEGVARLVLDALALRRDARPDAQTMAQRIDGLRGGGSPIAVTPVPMASLDLGARVAEGRAVRVDALDAEPAHARLGEDLTRALRDALAAERSVTVVASGGDVVVGGELRVSGERARVRLRATSAAGATVWSSRVEGPAADPFALEDRISEETAAAVRARLGTRVGPAPGPIRDAWERAVEKLNTIDPRATREGIAILEQLERDAPSEPTIQSALALGLVNLWLQTGSMDAVMAARGEELALRALDADPRLPDALFAVARLRLVQGDPRAALRGVRETLALAPTYAAAHFALGSMLCDTGRHEEGLRRMGVAARLAPQGGASLAAELRIRALLGQLDDVRASIARTQGTPVGSSMTALLAEICAWWDRPEMADEVAERIRSMPTGGGWERALPLFEAQARGERSEAVLAMTRQYFDAALVAHAPPGYRGMMARIGAGHFAWAGALEDALHMVEVAASQPGFIDLLWLDRAPFLAPLRESARFAVARAIVAARVAELGIA
jgi:hypothetical protein